MNALRNLNLRYPSTPQSKPENDRQVKNSAGGYSYQVADKDRFNRFLIMGTTGGTFYITEQDLTRDAAEFAVKYVAEHGVAAVQEAVRVSVEGLAPKNDPALFVLAVGMNSEDRATKRAAADAVLQVARTSTHLWTLCDFLKNLGGWGRAKTSAVAAWYDTKSDDQLGYQVAKYRQRDGWTHRDTLRLSHPKNMSKEIASFILRGEVMDSAPQVLRDYLALSTASNEREVIELIKSSNSVAWEFIPTEFLRNKMVWRELVLSGHVPLKAMLRNTKRFVSIGAFDDSDVSTAEYNRDRLGKGRDAASFLEAYVRAMTDKQKIEKSRIHPLDYLMAISAFRMDSVNIYPWGDDRLEAPADVISALDTGYRLSFKNVDKIQGSSLIAVDVSGSMFTPVNYIHSRGKRSDVTCAHAAAALAQVLMSAMDKTHVVGFSHEMVPLRIRRDSTVEEALESIDEVRMGMTDCALPMIHALRNNIMVDSFFVLTDSETWYGNTHPMEALREYRSKMNEDARLFVIALQGNDFTIADPEDPLCCDISGFDSSIMKIVESKF